VIGLRKGQENNFLFSKKKIFYGMCGNSKLILKMTREAKLLRKDSFVEFR